MTLEICARDAHARLLDPSAPPCLLDCREAHELALARVPGALHIPMAEIPNRLDDLPRDRDIIVHCHRGSRSLRVAAFLRSRGFERVVSLAGGIDAWSRDVDPGVPRY
ncbi:MAG: rhodanese-like domain-containing protein [Phycisphaerae bacterium]